MFDVDPQCPLHPSCHCNQLLVPVQKDFGGRVVPIHHGQQSDSVLFRVVVGGTVLFDHWLDKDGQLLRVELGYCPARVLQGHPKHILLIWCSKVV